MNKILKLGIGFATFFLLLLISCQQETNENDISPEALNQSSALTTLLRRVALADAVDDNVLDSASCIQLMLPLEVTVNGNLLTITDAVGFQQADSILTLSNSNDDIIDFDYPITAIYSDFEVTIENEEALIGYQQQCPWQPDPQLPPIDCINFQFPFGISLYDTNAQAPQIVTINNSYDLDAFLNGLLPTQFYQLNYPVTLTNIDFDVIDSNAELLAYIEDFGNNCDQCNNPHILTDDLVMYIPFANETVDLTTFTTPVVQGQFHYVTDRSGNPNGAISLDTADQNNRIDTALNANNNLLQNGAFTISFWFNRQSADIPQEFEQLYNSSEFGVFLGNQSNSAIRSPFVIAPGLTDPLYDIGWIQSGLLGEEGNWHHIAVTYTGSTGTLRLYRDGSLRNASSVVDFAGTLLGGGSFGGYFFGFLDDIRMYKRALSADEILQLYVLEGDVNTCLD